MSIKINQVELASDLAARELDKRFDSEPSEFPNGIIEDPTEECTTYTEEAQHYYDKMYDLFWDMIGSCQELSYH